MQGAKDSRYTFFLQFKEVIGDVVNVGYDSFVSCAFGVPFGGAWLETCREIEISVFATVCRTLDIEGVFFIQRVFPVPSECWDASRFPEAFRD